MVREAYRSTAAGSSAKARGARFLSAELGQLRKKSYRGPRSSPNRSENRPRELGVLPEALEGRRRELGVLPDGVGLPVDPSGLSADRLERCHAKANTGRACNGAPADVNLNDRASVYASLPLVREAAGVLHDMPFKEPRRPCERRVHLVTSIGDRAP